MAVLCEAYSVVVRRDAIEEYFDNGWSGFLENIPNGTMCTDEELVRVGFMDPALANEYIQLLLSNGLRFDSGRADLEIVDQNKGPINDCKWIQFLKTKLKDTSHDISICWLWEGHKPTEGVILKIGSHKIATPANWKPGLMEHGVGTDHLEYLRDEDGMTVYWDPKKKKEVFIVKSSNTTN